MTKGSPPAAEALAAPREAADRDAWCDALGALLSDAWPGIRVERVADTGSTNSDLLERVRASGPGPFTPTLLMADRQRAGRGRRGRTWQSAPGRSLTCSFAVPLAVADWSGLSLAVGVALAGALDGAQPTSRRRIGLKWPNDLWLIDADGGGRKLGGVLIESLPRVHDRVAVIGIGINVLAQAVDDASTGVACWHEVEPDASPEYALERIAAPLLLAMRDFERDGFGAFADRFTARDVLRGLAVRTSAPVLEGTVIGVSARGALRLRTAAGVRDIVSGEVSVRPIAPSDSSHGDSGDSGDSDGNRDSGDTPADPIVSRGPLDA